MNVSLLPSTRNFIFLNFPNTWALYPCIRTCESFSLLTISKEQNVFVWKQLGLALKKYHFLLELLLPRVIKKPPRNTSRVMGLNYFPHINRIESVYNFHLSVRFLKNECIVYQISRCFIQFYRQVFLFQIIIKDSLTTKQSVEEDFPSGKILDLG